MTPPPRATILVIEDDEAVLQTLVDLLELNGFRTRAARDGVEGLERARRETPSLIITDLSMPRATGFDLLGGLRADSGLRAIPVIIISARTERQATRRGMNLGADDFITKPFTEEEVIRSVTARLERKELVDELDAFAHTVAHDLKSPLHGLISLLDLIQELQQSESPEALRGFLQEASRSAWRLNAIIEDLLLLAGVRREPVVPGPLDMAAVVAESLERARSILRERQAEVHLPESWANALGHAPWVVHVWTNYLSNAARHAGPSPRITLGSGPSPDGLLHRFWVEDCGPGLSAEACESLFVPFSRLAAKRPGSHGLGLSIVRRIAEKLGGRVGVESRLGTGSRFWFELPAAGPGGEAGGAGPRPS